MLQSVSFGINKIAESERDFAGVVIGFFYGIHRTKGP